MIETMCPVCGIAYRDDSCRADSNPTAIRGGILAPMSQEEMEERCEDNARSLGECKHWRHVTCTVRI